MSSGESIIEIFKFYIGCLQKIFIVLDSFEFLPGISFLDFMIALVIISLLIKLLHFGTYLKKIESSLLELLMKKLRPREVKTLI